MCGNEALAEAAILAGCDAYSGYPITPQNEITAYMSKRMPEEGRIFVQSESELAAISMVFGAAATGKRVMTTSSSPGVSLMQEGISYLAGAELPAVVVNVMRGGPSTGLPTDWGQADLMQAKWGSHGDYGCIAVCPDSPQECFDLAIEAFNLSETYRLPVFLLTDAAVGHMTEKVVVPPEEKIHVAPRRLSNKKPGEYRPYDYGKDLVPDGIVAGQGYNIHTTGLTHDERGYPVMTAEAQDALVRRINDKIRNNTEKIIMTEEKDIEGAEVIVVSFGIASRVVGPAITQANKEGIKTGLLRLKTIWPFCEKRVRELAKKVKGFVVVEINYGQITLEVERCACGNAKVLLQEHMGAGVPTTEQILGKIREAAK